MSARPPKYKVVPVLLMVYLAAMAFVGYPRYAAGQMSALQYFGIIAATVAVIVLLFFRYVRATVAASNQSVWFIIVCMRDAVK